MEIRVELDGTDVSDSVLLADTRINYDMSRRISQATVTFMGGQPGAVARFDSAIHDGNVFTAGSSTAPRFDYANFDQVYYTIDVHELASVIIYRRSDNYKMFAGQIGKFDLVPSWIGTFSIFYKCSLNDYSAILDRTYAWDSTVVTLPASDQRIIQELIAAYAPEIDTSLVMMMVPVISAYEYANKSLRSILDDIVQLSAGEWSLDFDKRLHYGPVSSAPPAPFAVSSAPDHVSSMPYNLQTYTRDFSNPINRCHVRGNWTATGTIVDMEYQDPVSIALYGEYEYGIFNNSLASPLDAFLQAQTTVLKYAYPLESGTFKIWTDGLAIGQLLHIVQEDLAIDNNYIIRSLALQWLDNAQIEYTAQFGQNQPDLEMYLRELDQRTRWESSTLAPSTGGTPGPGTVTDSSIASPGLSANSIYSVNASSILGQILANQIGSISASSIIGQITAGQIGSVDASTIIGQIDIGQVGSINASQIIGQLQASQIASVSATTIQGVLTAGQIGSVSAVTIQGVIVSSQLANGIIDSLAKYVTALQPVPMIKAGDPIVGVVPPNGFFYYIPDGHFYQMTADGQGWFQNDNVQNSLMQFYHIGAVNASSIVGLIVAAQIQSVLASTITGQVSANQIASVNASAIIGGLTANQITSVYTTALQGQITANQIASIDVNTIQGNIVIYAQNIVGQITANQIASVYGQTITVGSIDSSKLAAGEIDIGGGGGKPGRILVWNAAGNGYVSIIGNIDGTNYGIWALVAGFGGTGYNDSKVRTDLAGNLYITDSSLTITNAATSTQINTGPFNFDNSYGSIALDIYGSADLTRLVSRGMVLYYGGTKVGSFVRDPLGAFASIELPTPGYVEITGALGGRVRADGGFQVVGNVGVTAQVNTIDGTDFFINGGIITGYTNRTIIGIWQSIYVTTPGGTARLDFVNGICTFAG